MYSTTDPFHNFKILIISGYFTILYCRHGVSTTYGKSVQSFEDDPELTYQLHQTLADFEASLAGKTFQ